eukprot:8366658-Lingulodinium_polyedra.AAC.1
MEFKGPPGRGHFSKAPGGWSPPVVFRREQPRFGAAHFPFHCVRIIIIIIVIVCLAAQPGGWA